MKIDATIPPRMLIRLYSAALLLCANVFLFAPYTVYRSNPEEFEIGFLDMMGTLAWPAMGLIAAIAIAGRLIGQRWLPRYISAVFALGVLTWMQSSFLLWDYGVFDGRDKNWSGYYWLGWLDLALWLAVLTLCLFYVRHALKVIILVSWLLLLGQGMPIVTEEVDRQDYWNRSVTAWQPKGLSAVSEKQNVFHLVLDSFQTDVFLELLQEKDAFTDFSGFVLFRDNAAASPHTSIAVPATLLGSLYTGYGSPADFYAMAMREGIQSKLFDAGFEVSLSPLLSMEDSPRTDYFEVSSVYRDSPRQLARNNTARLLDVGLFRSAPHFLRLVIYDSGNWSLQKRLTGEIQSASFRHKAFFTDYTERLHLGSANSRYHFVHLHPPHPPYVTLPDGRYAGRVLENTRRNYLSEARAVFELLVGFLHKLQALGVYEKSMIILQGDHGSQIEPVMDGQALDPCLPRLPALLAVKRFNAASGPLRISDAPTSLLDVAPTILASLNGEPGPLFSVEQGTERSRPFLTFRVDEHGSTYTRYAIEGSVFDPRSCRFAEKREVDRSGERYQYGSPIRFGVAGDAYSVLKDGWTACHARHCWSSGHEASLQLKVASPGLEHELEVVFKPFLSKPEVSHQTVRVHVNGHLVETWTATADRALAYRTRVPAKAVGSELHISFVLPDAVAPADVGAGGDHRTLGIAVSELTLKPIDK